MIKYYKIEAITPLAGCNAYEYVYIKENEKVLRFKDNDFFSTQSLAEYANDFACDNGEEAFFYADTDTEEWDYEDFMKECYYGIEEISKEEFEMEA